MKDTRASILLFLSLMLFIISLVILSTWGFSKYFSSASSNNQAKIASQTPPPNQQSAIASFRDSLEKIYTETVNKLGNKMDTSIMVTDSLRIPINNQIEEYGKLKTEIIDLLNEKGGAADLELAKQKIEQLQQKVRDLLGKYNKIETENKRLQALLNKPPDNDQFVSSGSSAPAKGSGTPVAVHHSSSSVNPPATQKLTPPSKINFFTTYDLKLSAWTITDNKEIETYKAYQADKFIGSFVVKNPGITENNVEMIVVITAPNGHILQKSSWESGTFETVKGEKKIYTMKVRFDYNQGEPKRILFTLPQPDFIQGTYIMQVYYNGALIGKATRSLG